MGDDAKTGQSKQFPFSDNAPFFRQLSHYVLVQQDLDTATGFLQFRRLFGKPCSRVRLMHDGVFNEAPRKNQH